MSETATTETKEKPYATINPATCGGRIEVECSAMGCHEQAKRVHRTSLYDLEWSAAIPLCVDHLKTTDKEGSA